MGIFSRFKEDLEKMRKQLSENNILRENEAQAKAEITRLRIDRHHATEEMKRAQEQMKVHTAILAQASPSDPAFQAAKEGIELCVQKQNEAIARIQAATELIEQGKQYKSDVHQALKDANKEVIMNMLDRSKENFHITKEEIADTVVSMPETVAKRAEFTADLMTAKLHDLNDTMDAAIHESKDKGLSAFAKLLDKVPAIDRVYRNIQIRHLEKEYAKNEKIEQALSKIEKVADLKVTQAKEAGHAIKNLFTKWKEEPAQQPKDKQNQQLDEFNKEMKEKKPGFLRRIINTDQKNLASELETLYKEQMKSYEKTIEKAQERADYAVDKGYQTLEQSINQINMTHTQEVQDLAAKAINMSNEQVKRSQDDMTR